MQIYIDQSGKVEQTRRERLLILGGRLLFRLENKNNGQCKNSDGQSSDRVSKQEIIHSLEANLVNCKLKNQHTPVNTNPISTIMKSVVLSIPEKKGAITKPARKTWPALSKILARRSNSALANTMEVSFADNYFSVNDDGKMFCGLKNEKLARTGASAHPL